VVIISEMVVTLIVELVVMNLKSLQWLKLFKTL
jgi:hypothetical protein